MHNVKPREQNECSLLFFDIIKAPSDLKAQQAVLSESENAVMEHH